METAYLALLVATAVNIFATVKVSGLAINQSKVNQFEFQIQLSGPASHPVTEDNQGNIQKN